MPLREDCRARRKCLYAILGLFGVLAPQIANSQDTTLPKPAMSASVRNKLDRLIENVYEAEAELRVPLRGSKVIRTKMEISRAAVADPSIVEFVAFGTTEVELIGKTTGATTVTFWLEDADGTTQLLTFLVNVERDNTVEDRRRLEYGELQQMLNEMFPDSKVQLIPIADKVIIRGQARDAEEATQIMSIVRRRGTSGGMGGGLGGIGLGLVNGQAAEPFPDGSTLPMSNVVNMLRVPGEQQVMLKVRIAELKRSAVRRLGVNFDFQAGDFFFQSLLAAGVPNALLNGTFDQDSFNVFLDALEQNRAAKILAEPNLVVLSGNTATFISGGEFAVPTVVGVGGAQAATTSFRGFGTQLTFTPTVLDKDRIRLQVNPEFSTLNSTNSVGGIFGVDTRAASTVVELREGQVLAIAGLIQEQQNGTRNGLPGLNKIPGIGVLFNGKSITRDETELLVVVSPEIVHPLEPDEIPALMPGMDVTEPDDFDFYLRSRIEGHPEHHHRSTVWPNYYDQIRNPKLYNAAYMKSEKHFMHGPRGFSN